MTPSNGLKWVSYRVLLKSGKALENEGYDPDAQDVFLKDVFSRLTEKATADFNSDGFIYTTYPYDSRKCEGVKTEFGDEPYQYVTVRFRIPAEQEKGVSDYINGELTRHQSAGKYVKAFKRIDDWGLGNPGCYDNYGGLEVADLIDDYLIQISRITLDLLLRENEMTVPEGFLGEEKKRMFLVANQWAHILFRQFGYLDQIKDGVFKLQRFR